jgi:dienelactone hydrolase
MSVISNTVAYLDGDVLLEAFFAFDDAFQGRRPAVLINHTWAGRDEFVAEKAKKLAALGYVGFAVDMYGKDIMGSSPEENEKLMRPFMNNRQMLQKRMQAALYAVKLMPWVDDSKIAAIGFCFGGLCALDLARTGVELKGVVSFHGLLGKPDNTQGNIIKAKILALHGHDDPLAPVDQVLAFEQEMTSAGADWQLHTFGNTLHAFTNPQANSPDFGMAYQADADRRSWLAMENFMTEVFA